MKQKFLAMLSNLVQKRFLYIVYGFSIIIFFASLQYFIDISVAMAIGVILYVSIAIHGIIREKYNQHHQWIAFWTCSSLIGNFYTVSSEWYDYFMLLFTFCAFYYFDNIIEKQIKSKLDN